MIKGFRCKDTEKLFNLEVTLKFPTNIKRVAIRKLEMLDVADSLNRLRIPPSNRLEKLSSDRKGQHSIRINRQWRVCFHWESGNAYDVEIADYHKG